MNVELSRKELEILVKWSGQLDSDQTWMIDDEVELLRKIKSLLGI
jgi:hypothetical protein